jgi:PST family polysaccharide transporter
MLSRRHNVRAHFWQTCSNYTQQISGLLLSVLLARLLTPEAFGEYAYVAAVLGLSVLPASWSLSPQVVAEIRSHPAIKNDALHYSRKLLLPRLILLGGACLFLFVTNGWKQGLLGLVFAIPLAGHEFLAVLRSSLEGNGEFKANFFDSLLTAGYSALLSLPAAWLGAGVWSFAIPAIPLFISQLILFTRMSGIGFRPTAPLSGRGYFKSASQLWLATCSDGALVRLDKFFLGRFVDMPALGDYNRAFNFTPVAARALSSLLASPTVSALTRAPDRRSRFALIIKASGLLLTAGFANFLVWWFFSAPLVPWLFGPQWQNAVPVFEAMAPLSLALSIAYLPSTLAIAHRAYAELAVVRVVTLLAFGATAVLLGSKMTPVIMAWLLQLTLVVQGIALFIAILPVCARHDRELV